MTLDYLRHPADFPSAADLDRAQCDIETAKGIRADELHSDAKLLALTAMELFDADPLIDLLAALMTREKNATAGDNMILQHCAATEVIDKLVWKIVDHEFRE